MTNKDIGIGIIDVYSDLDLQNCLNSIPDELKDNVVVVCNKKKTSKSNKHYSSEVSFATLRNYVLTQLRIMGFKYYFIINSNVTIKNSDIFNKTINLANTFGTWFITGPGNNNITLEDDSNNLELNLSPNLNTNFIFLYSGIVKNFKFFDERYFNGKNLDVLDYIIKMRKEKVYPPNHYNPTIAQTDIVESPTQIEKINFQDVDGKNDKLDKSLQLSFAYFYHQHKYIPSQNDPVGVTQDELLEFMDTLQKQYANKK